jgi:hypothetical protein
MNPMNSMHQLTQRQADPSAKTPGVVVVYGCKGYGNPHCHESGTQTEVARKLAALKNYDFAGEFDPSCWYDARPLYFVPGETIVDVGCAHELGIRGEHDLFGGVVPFAFVATKTITHALPDAASQAPIGWSAGFAHQVRDVVLPGFSAFSLQDARNAGMRMLQYGKVRVKIAGGIGGLGQWVVADADELESRLCALEEQDLLRSGVVLEKNLTEVVTHSVGQVRVGNLLASYYGRQRLTRNNRGTDVYGGSELTVVRGDFDALLGLANRIDLAPEVRTAVAQARTYHSAAMTSFSGMFASRCNYDIAQGRDDAGQWYSGVLEQSWRMGGASGAELAALDAFGSDPSLTTVCASTTEIYGADAAVPADAIVYFQGTDQRVGPITKYSRIESYANT